MTRQASISCKAPAQTALPRMAGDEAASSSEDNECFQDTRTNHVGRLIKNLNYRYTGGGESHVLEILNAKHHADGERPGCTESDGDGTANGQGDSLFWLRDFLGHVRGAIEACERPLWIH